MSERRPCQIFLIGLVGVFVVFFGQLMIGWAAVALAALPFVFVMFGHFFLPVRKAAISVSLNPEMFRFTHAPKSVEVSISGQRMQLGPLLRHLEFDVVQRNYVLLTGVAMASMATTVWVWPYRTHNIVRDDIFTRAEALYFGWSVWLIVILLAWRWVHERRLLRRVGVVLAHLEPAGTGRFHLPRVRYWFIAPNGERYGDIVQQYSRQRSDLELIFFDLDDPTKSAPASALFYHTIAWHAVDAPGANEQSAGGMQS